MIEFDLNGRKVAFDEGVVRNLCAKARAGAGSSSTFNALAVILDRALTERKPITLRRAEAREFERLLELASAKPETAPANGQGDFT